MLTVVAPGRVDGAACDALARVPGVDAAGAVALPPGARVTPVALPGAPLPLGSATPGFPGVLRAESDGGPGLLLAGDAARALGTGVGGALRTTDGTTRVSGTYEYPRDGRRAGYGYLALATVRAAGTFDECWVDVWPQDPGTRSLLLTTVVSGGAEADEQPELAPLNVTHGLEFDGYARFHDRVTGWAGPAVAVLGAVVGLLALRARRVQLAAALHDGVSRIDLTAVVLVESVAWVVPPVVVSLMASTVLLATHGEAGVGLVLGARISSALAAGVLVGAGAAMAATRERDLFRYAKDR